MTSRRVGQALLLATLSLSASSCRRGADTSHAAPSQTVGYPHGPWWRGDLSRTLLCAEHILVTYEGSGSASDGFISPIPNHRTKDAALASALSLSARLKQHPAEFEAEAARASDDSVSKELNGALGCARTVSYPAGVVDALGNLEYDEVSDVVPTELGFHVVKRVREPAQYVVDAQEIVIVHSGSRLSEFTPPGAPARRSRDEAVKFATETRNLALAHPETFGELADARSDDKKNAHGDLGGMSTYDLYFEPEVMAALVRLPVNGISRVFETPTLGFRIFKRTEPRPRDVLSHRALAFRYEPAQGEREKARAAAEKLLQELLAKPSSGEHFDGYCADHECYGPFTYTDGGAGVPDLGEELKKVAVGEVVPRVVETVGAYEVVRRLAPGALPELADTFTLPRPERKTLANASAKEFGDYLDLYSSRVRSELHLTEAQLGKFTELVKALREAITQAPREQWAALVDESRKRTIAELGPKVAKDLSDFDAALQFEMAGELKPRRM